MKVQVIIPAFNEGSVITGTIQPLLKMGYDVIVVDDASTDSTRDVLSNMPVHYLRHRINLGQGAALQTGIDYALTKEVDFIISFDADGQHDPMDIEGMISKLVNEDLDIVFASRFLKGAHSNTSRGRKLLLQAGRYLNYFFTGILLSDAHNGLRVMNRKTAGLLQLKENRMAHASEILFRVKEHKLKYGEYPSAIIYTDYSRRKGQSAWNSLRIFVEMVLNKLFD